jgi:hypothetical protein
MQSGASFSNEDIIDFAADPRWFSTHPGEWETLKANEKYKIYTHSPHPILNTISGKILKETKRGNGGICISFGNGYISKVKILIQQWPEKCFTRPQYRRNAAYEIADELPEGATEVKTWNGWNFENLYFCNDDFYQFVGQGYRKLHKCLGRDKRNEHINVIDSSNCPRAISYFTFKAKYLTDLYSSQESAVHS